MVCEPRQYVSPNLLNGAAMVTKKEILFAFSQVPENIGPGEYIRECLQKFAEIAEGISTDSALAGASNHLIRERHALAMDSIGQARNCIKEFRGDLALKALDVAEHQISKITPE